jgi:hypothetical protein
MWDTIQLAPERADHVSPGAGGPAAGSWQFDSRRAQMRNTRAGRLAAVATALGLPLLAGAAASGATLFSENFNDGNAASRWSTAVQTEATAATTTGPDGSVNFNFDYGTLGIPAAPNGTGTTGAFIQVNNTDQTGDEGETYVVYPNGQSFTAGNFILTADMFVWNDLGASGAGTTELGMTGAFLNNADPVAPYQWGTRGGPLAWAYSGEGGSTADFAVFKEGNAASTGYAGLADYNTVPADSIPGFETGVAGAGGPASDAAPNGAWAEIMIRSEGSTIGWYVNGALVDSYDNSGGFYTAGNIFLGATDPFNSVNPAGGTIIDNVRVTEVPEPAALATLALAGMALMRGRRRNG